MMPLAVEGSDSSKSVRPWLYFVVVTAALGFLCYEAYDLKQDVKKTTAQVRESNDTLKQKLPTILDNSEKATTALVRMTDDVAVLRNLVGPFAPNSNSDSSIALAKFATTLLDNLEKEDLTISSKLQSKPCKQWVADERKECLILAFRVSSKREMVEGISSTSFGNAWTVTTKSGQKMPMLDWLRKNPEIDALFLEKAK